MSISLLFSCVDKSCPILSETHTLESIMASFSDHLVGMLDRTICGAKPVMHKAKLVFEGGRS